MNFLKILVILSFVSTIVIGCNSEHRNETSDDNSTQEPSFDTLNLKTQTNFSLNYNNEDFNEFGIQFYEHDLPVGPTDILLSDNSIFVLDQYHNNLKKLNFQGEIVKASSPLSKERIWVKQFSTIKDRILVISELDSLYIYSLELELLKRQYLKNSNGQIFNTYEDKIVLYSAGNNHEFIEINEQGEIINRISGYEHKADYTPNESFSNSANRIGNMVFMTPIDLKEHFHYVQDKTIIVYNKTQERLIFDLYFY